MVPVFTLKNEVRMPALGMGTFPLNGIELSELVVQALQMGYELFDTSAAYGNESSLGQGLLLSRKPRSSFFLTSKVCNRDQYENRVEEALDQTLKQLRTDYLDLYLIHWPVPGLFQKTWLTLVEMQKQGKVRAIGVANFHPHHLEELARISDVVPAVDQVELHPLLSQQPLREYCRERGIQLEAYSPVARMHEKLILHPGWEALKKRYGKTVPQLILRWDFQHEVIAIPKASSPDRLRENLDIFDFELSEEDMAVIDGMNCNFRVRYDPDHCDMTKL